MSDPTVRIDLSADAYETIASETARHLPRETGGILLGYREGLTVVVTHALLVAGNGATPHRYVRDDARANVVLTNFLKERAEEDPIGYVGEWHSHPAPVGPSLTDVAALRATCKAADGPVALLVYAPGEANQFYGMVASRRRFRRITESRASVGLPISRFKPLGPLPDGAVRNDGPVFISYRQWDGSEQADSIEGLLRAAGLVVWRDHSDLRAGTTTDRLEQALTQGLSAGVLIVTPDIVYSDVVRERELPRLLQLDANPDFSLCIANEIARGEEKSKCDYGAPDRLLRLYPARTLADKKQANVRVPSGELEIVRDLLMHRVEQRKPSIRKTGRDFSIRVQSRPDAFAIDAGEEDLHIRIKPSPSGRLPSRTGLEQLRWTLPITSDAVNAAGTNRVEVSGGAHLSVGLALGASLPEPMIAHLIVRDGKDNLWKSDVSEASPKTTELTIENSPSKDVQPTDGGEKVAIFVSLTLDPDRTAFEKLVNESDGNFAASEVVLVSGSERVDHRESGRLSWDIARRIRRLSASRGRAEVHLAFHGPFPMAILIGRHLNTLRTVVYEWEFNEDDGPNYKPVIVLEPGAANGPITTVLE